MRTKPASRIVIAGTGNITWESGQEPISTIDLMCRAVEDAADDAGSRKLLRKADQIFIPKGTWSIDNPGSSIASAFGIEAKNVLFDLGVLQSSLVKRAIQDVAEARSECTIIVGGETKELDKRLHGAIPTSTASDVTTANVLPEWVRAEELVISRHEIDTGLIRAADQYALIENAYAHENNLTRGQLIDLINEEWKEMAKISEAANAPWRKNACQYLDEQGWGRPIADPYCVNHITQWNVNQSAALIITTEETAKAFGSSGHSWVYPKAIIESNNVTPLTERQDLSSCIAMRFIDEKLKSLTGKAASDREIVELYSCFPIAVRLQSEHLGLYNHDLSVTGGMTFAGGPFNNFTIQGISCVAKKIRDQETDGLVTSISGMLTKQGLFALSAKSDTSDFFHEDVSTAVKRAMKTVDIKPDINGRLRIISSTIAHTSQGPKAFVIAESDDHYRRVVTTLDPETTQAFSQDSHIGGVIDVDSSGSFEIETQ